MKTVKTAGTSVEIYFEPYCRDDDAPPTHQTEQHVSPTGIVGYRGGDPTRSQFYNHIPAKVLHAAVGDDVWNRYFKFTVVRNPFDKAISAFWMFKNIKSEPMNVSDFFEIKQEFKKYLRTQKLPADNAIFTEDGKLCCNYYIRYEALLPDLAAVCERIGVSFNPSTLGTYKSDIRPSVYTLRDYYDAETISLVRDFYASEFKWFGYSDAP